MQIVSPGSTLDPMEATTTASDRADAMARDLATLYGYTLESVTLNRPRTRAFVWLRRPAVGTCPASRARYVLSLTRP